MSFGLCYGKPSRGRPRQRRPRRTAMPYTSPSSSPFSQMTEGAHVVALGLIRSVARFRRCSNVNWIHTPKSGCTRTSLAPSPTNDSLKSNANGTPCHFVARACLCVRVCVRACVMWLQASA
jgi:hypothetical protein